MQWTHFCVDGHQVCNLVRLTQSMLHAMLTPHPNPCHRSPQSHSCSLQCRLTRSSDTLGLPLLPSIHSFVPLSSALSPFLPTRSCSSCFLATVIPLHKQTTDSEGTSNCPPVSDSPKSASFGQVRPSDQVFACYSISWLPAPSVKGCWPYLYGICRCRLGWNGCLDDCVPWLLLCPCIKRKTPS